MKITFLLTGSQNLKSAEESVLAVARHLAAQHDVRIMSVFGPGDKRSPSEDRGGPLVESLVDVSGKESVPTRDTLLSADECRLLSELGSEVVDERWRLGFNRLTDLEMRSAFGAIRSDVIVTSDGALTAAAIRFAPAGAVMVQQESGVQGLRELARESLLANAPFLDAFVGATHNTLDWLKDSLASSAPRLEWIPPITAGGFHPRSSLTGRTIVLGGSMVKGRRFDHAVKAFSRLSDQHHEWSMRIYGKGPEEDRLKRLVNGIGLNDRIVFPGHTENMGEEWAKASLCVVTADGGSSLPGELFEAMKAGVPTVAYDQAVGATEFVRHGVDGLLVGDGDIDSLAASIDGLVSDHDRLTRFGLEAIDSVSRFSPESIMATWEQLFNDLVDRRNDAVNVSARVDRVARAALVTERFHTAVPIKNPQVAQFDQKAREGELLHQNPNLERSGGRLAEVRDDILAHAMFDENLKLVAESLERHHVPYVLLDSSTNHTQVAVPESVRQQAMEAMAEGMVGSAVYGELISPATAAPGSILAENLHAVGEVKGVRIFRPIVSRTRTLRYGPEYGCFVEFWPEDPVDGFWHAPLRTTALGSVFESIEADASVRRGDRDYPTLHSFTRPFMSKIDFPIDAVWTWVDDSDPLWRARLDATREEFGLDVIQRGADESRFRNRDELRYSLRSVAMFAPWIRNIYLVTDDQVPVWLATDHPQVTVVSHRELFADEQALPTFNSHAIASQLHRIPGLSEHFLYFNDDVFLGQPLDPDRFFLSNGVAKTFHSSTAISMAPVLDSDDAHIAARKNSRALVEQATGKILTHGYRHTPHALRRSLLEEIEEQFNEDWDRTAHSQFRRSSDLVVLSALHHEYGYMTGRVVKSSIGVGYVNIGRYEQHRELMRLLTLRNKEVFCLNDTTDADVPVDEQARVVEAFLRSYFPIPSPYERQGS